MEYEDENLEQYEYTPITFLKCHSRIKCDRNDRVSKVWMCAFEPNKDFPDKFTTTVATCGASSVCLISVSSGKIESKYFSKDSNEDFYTLSWSTLFMKIDGKKIKSNVLAAAGAKCTVHLFHPEKQICFLEEKIRMPKGTSISSLQFHPLARNVLCCGFSDGQVHILDLGEPSPNDYEVKLVRVHALSIENEIFNMTFSRHCESLLAATDDGVTAWTLGLQDVNKASSKISMYKFNFPTNRNNSTLEQQQDSDQLVDSVEPIENGRMIATKCALHGVIYIWDLKEAIQNCDNEGSLSVVPIHILNYSNTDNYFMSMGSSISSGLLACGDDEGYIWLYDLNEVFSKAKREQDQSAVIPWPIVTDSTKENLRVVHQEEVVINKVIVDHKRSYIVAVTNTNLVCIWKKDGKLKN